jgi:lysophospholipase L1-like esterase
MLYTSILVALACTQQPPAKQKQFVFKDGDRIVWIGNTLVEREQRYGYWESALLVANQDKTITFRNLGWSGDTVFGDARAGFDNAAKGFERLVSLTLELKPTVIFVSYGTNEAFEGKEGLAKFEKGLEKLLDALAPANARIVLFTPLPFDTHTRFPEAMRRNDTLGQYRDVIQKVAENRKHYFADLFNHVIYGSKWLELSLPKGTHPNKSPYTDNGLHLTDEGYELLAGDFVGLFGTSPAKSLAQHQVEISNIRKLSKAVVEKNQLFFYRWRPQNETYLFGFRKHEQGKNGKEVAEFDPLVGKAEEEIKKILKSIDK